ncbi:MAG: GNAT family N-acetyltransferase, partial [Clostridia bacterium]|nr:GNAT family N-acetyltransferase [Clostridia bacterium]
MEIKIFSFLPDEAMKIRVEVFVDEQGFVDLPDETDLVALHFVGYIGTLPVATCRAFEGDDDCYILG